MADEIVPGLFHWQAFHDGIHSVVHSALDVRSGTLIDPMVPTEEGIEAVAELCTPHRIVLTNRHHYRDSDRFRERFGCPVLCHEAGLHHFATGADGEQGGRDMRGFTFDEQIVSDVRALELNSICAEETTLLLELADGVLCFGDGLTRARDGSLAFMPDRLLGDDPEGVRAGLVRNLRRMLEEDFDALLFAHAEPIAEGGRAMLERFLARVAVYQQAS